MALTASDKHAGGLNNGSGGVPTAATAVVPSLNLNMTGVPLTSAAPAVLGSADRSQANDAISASRSLIGAVLRGNLAEISRYVKRGADVNAFFDDASDTALHVAVMLENAELVELLLTLGAQPALRDLYGLTPLHLAAELPSDAILKLLVQSNSTNGDSNSGGSAAADIDALDESGNSPLLYAVSAGRLATVRYLHQIGATFELANAKGATAAHVAASSACASGVDILQFLSEINAPLAVAAPDIGTPLMMAVATGSLDCFALLWDRTSPDLSVLRDAAVLAASEGHLAILKLLTSRVLSLGSDVDLLNAALLAALASNQSDIASWFLNSTDLLPFLRIKEHVALLHHAVGFGMTAIATQLLRLGADVEARDYNGMTPILVAAAHGHHKLVHELLEHGAVLRARDHDDYGILHHACRSDRTEEELLVSLLEFGLSPNEHNKHGESPLMVAVGQTNELALRLLLSHLARNAPRDPLGELKLWAKGPYLQAVVELSEADFVADRVALRDLDYCRVLSGTYMGLSVVALQYKAPVDTRLFAFQMSLTNHLRHRALSTLLGAFSDGVTYTQLFEFPGKSRAVLTLHSLIYKSSHRLTPPDIVLLAQQLLYGLREMHREGAGKPMIVHRNIQSAAVLLNEKVGPMLADFASGTHSSAGLMLPHCGRVGPLGWVPPEVLMGFAFDEKVDVFSFALLLYEMRECRVPFSDHHLFDLPRKLIAGDRPKCAPQQTPRFAAVDRFIVSTMERCWAQQPAERPSFEQLAVMFDECAAQHCQGSIESLEELYHAVAFSDTAVDDDRIRSLGAVPESQVSTVALSLDEGAVPEKTHRLALHRVSIESTEYFAKLIPLSIVQKRRMELFQMRAMDIEQLPTSTRIRGSSNVLRVLYNDVTAGKVRLLTHRFDGCLYDRVRVMANDKRQYWSPAEVRDMALQIACGMEFLCKNDVSILFVRAFVCDRL